MWRLLFDFKSNEITFYLFDYTNLCITKWVNNTFFVVVVVFHEIPHKSAYGIYCDVTHTVILKRT